MNSYRNTKLLFSLPSSVISNSKLIPPIFSGTTSICRLYFHQTYTEHSIELYDQVERHFDKIGIQIRVGKSHDADVMFRLCGDHYEGFDSLGHRYAEVISNPSYKSFMAIDKENKIVAHYAAEVVRNGEWIIFQGGRTRREWAGRGLFATMNLAMALDLTSIARGKRPHWLPVPAENAATKLFSVPPRDCLSFTRLDRLALTNIGQLRAGHFTDTRAIDALHNLVFYITRDSIAEAKFLENSERPTRERLYEAVKTAGRGREFVACDYHGFLQVAEQDTRWIEHCISSYCSAPLLSSESDGKRQALSFVAPEFLSHQLVVLKVFFYGRSFDTLLAHLRHAIAAHREQLLAARRSQLRVFFPLHLSKSLFVQRALEELKLTQPAVGTATRDEDKYYILRHPALAFFVSH